MDPSQQPNQSATVEMPNQPSVPVQPAFPVSQSAHEMSQLDSIQNDMKSRILKIIGALSAVSFVGILLTLWISGVGDVSLDARVVESNAQAEYQVPDAWNGEGGLSGSTYYNGDTPEGSQVSYNVTVPTKVSFSSVPLTEQEVISVLEEFVENSDALRSGQVALSDRANLITDDFNYAYEYAVQQSGQDGIPVEGRLQVRFDSENYIHITEMAAISTYWTNNAEPLIDIMGNYRLK